MSNIFKLLFLFQRVAQKCHELQKDLVLERSGAVCDLFDPRQVTADP